MISSYKNNLAEITPEDALQILNDGNQRFVNGLSRHRNPLEDANGTEHQQKPFAVILSCMDSRAPVETIFDQGIGDIFSVRIAGNIISDNVIGSLEYAVGITGSKVLVVMGHTNCGAVKGACDQVEFGHLTVLLDKIKPAIEQETTETENRTGSNKSFVDKVALLNVRHSIQGILKQSEIIRSAVADGSVRIVPAMYQVASGQVSFVSEGVPA